MYINYTWQKRSTTYTWYNKNTTGTIRISQINTVYCGIYKVAQKTDYWPL